MKGDSETESFFSMKMTSPFSISFSSVKTVGCLSSLVQDWKRKAIAKNNAIKFLIAILVCVIS